MITNEGTMIRTPVSDIRVCGRPSQGVIVMRLSEDAHVVNFAAVKDEEQAAKDAEKDAELLVDETETAEITELSEKEDEIELLEIEVDESDDDI